MKKIISTLLAFVVFAQSGVALAQTAPGTNVSATAAREFYVARDLGRPLITVHLLNGVTTPGVYHVPIETDLAQLIAFAGGATERSDLAAITIRRGDRGRYSVSSLDLEKALREPKDLFRVQDQDVIQIEQKYSPEKSLQWIGIISGLASVVLSIYLVNDLSKKN